MGRIFWKAASLILCLIAAGIFVNYAHLQSADYHDVLRPELSKEVTFYSGGTGGFYSKIGDVLEAATADEITYPNPQGEPEILKLAEQAITYSPSQATYEFKEIQTDGSYDNAGKLISSNHALGILENSTLATKPIADGVKKIAPIYQSRLHVIYDHAAFVAHVEGVAVDCLGSDPKDREVCHHPSIVDLNRESLDQAELLDGIRPVLSSPADSLTTDFFKRSQISIGSNMSGTAILAARILRATGVFVGSRRRDLTFSESLKLLTAQAEGGRKKFSVVFIMAGAPLADLKPILEEGDGHSVVENAASSGRFRLMDVTPQLVSDYNQLYGVEAIHTDFSEIYSGGEDVATLGDYDMLVASKDLPMEVAIEALSILENNAGNCILALPHERLFEERLPATCEQSNHENPLLESKALITGGRLYAEAVAREQHSRATTGLSGSVLVIILLGGTLYLALNRVVSTASRLWLSSLVAAVNDERVRLRMEDATSLDVENLNDVQREVLLTEDIRHYFKSGQAYGAHLEQASGYAQEIRRWASLGLLAPGDEEPLMSALNHHMEQSAQAFQAEVLLFVCYEMQFVIGDGDAAVKLALLHLKAYEDGWLTELDQWVIGKLAAIAYGGRAEARPPSMLLGSNSNAVAS